VVENLIWSLTVRADGGPKLTGSGTLQAEAYDKLSVVVPAGGDVSVELGPGDADRMTCLVILPAAPSEDLTYDVNGTNIALDQPHFLLGGAVNLTGNPAVLTLTNGAAEDAGVEILQSSTSRKRGRSRTRPATSATT
jgi:hypothetical protein